MRGNVVELVIIHYVNKSIASNRAMLFTPLSYYNFIYFYKCGIISDYYPTR